MAILYDLYDFSWIFMKVSHFGHFIWNCTIFSWKFMKMRPKWLFYTISYDFSLNFILFLLSKDFSKKLKKIVPEIQYSNDDLKNILKFSCRSYFTKKPIFWCSKLMCSRSGTGELKLQFYSYWSIHDPYLSMTYIQYVYIYIYIYNIISYHIIYIYIYTVYIPPLYI